MKRPSFQFYPADWRKDAALQSCGIAAQGLWINVMCIAHECEPYGHLTVNGRPMSAAQLARLVGLGAKECERLVEELEVAGVLSRTEEGAIYSRRMARDETLRTVRAAGGKGGSEHGQKGASHGTKGGRPKKGTGVIKTPLTQTGRGVLEPPIEPPPSSSSSSSASAVLSASQIGQAAPAPSPVADRPERKPPDSPHHRSLAAYVAAWESVYGAKYLIDGGRDGGMVRDILAELDGDEGRFLAALGRFFAERSGFLLEARHPLTAMKKQLNRYTTDIPRGIHDHPNGRPGPVVGRPGRVQPPPGKYDHHDAPGPAAAGGPAGTDLFGAAGGPPGTG